MNPDTVLIKLIILLAAVVNYRLVIGEKKNLKAFNASATYLNPHSHEELHSKNESNSLVHGIKYANLSDLNHSNDSTAIDSDNNAVRNKLLLKTDLFLNSTIMASSLPPHQASIVSERGVEVVSSTKDSLKINSNTTNKSHNTTIDITPKITHRPLIITETIDSMTKQPAVLTLDKLVHKRIHGRPGVSELDIPLVSSTFSSTSSTSTMIRTTTNLPRIPKKKKPLFTMIKDDKESKESESFIESPTTGRDYVLPIVLTILSLPVAVYMIKVIYRRGTEFTERQQYHRMYLIDGMYNSSFSIQKHGLDEVYCLLCVEFMCSQVSLLKFGTKRLPYWEPPLYSCHIIEHFCEFVLYK